jgi:hypothetical protein
MTSTITRRTLLKSLMAGGALATLPIMQTSRLLAAEGDVPLRIVFFDLPTGLLRNEWIPRGQGGMPATTTQWELSGMMSPLAPFKDRINFFKNMDMYSSRFDTTSAGNAHQGGSTHALTGDVRVIGQGSRSSGISVDQYIAQKLEEQGTLTRLTSLDVGGTKSWLGKGTKVQTTSDAQEIYRRAFGSLALPTEEIQRLSASRAFIKGRHDAALKNLGGQDRAVIESHRDIRDRLFERLSLTNPTRDAYAPSPSQFDTIQQTWMTRTGPDVTNWHNTNGLAGELIALALHSDSTRVASFGLSKPPAESFGYTSGNWGTSDIHDLEHKTSGAIDNLQGDFQMQGPGYQAQVARHTREVEALAAFLAQLDALPETDGKTLLDHTIVVCVSHISNGSHSLGDLPWMVIGDAQGFFKTGQFIQFERGEDRYSGRAHNDLFVSLIQAMRLEAQPRSRTDLTPDRFGLAEACTGPILELHA